MSLHYILIFGNVSDPGISVLTLQISNQQVMNSPGIRHKVMSSKWGTAYHPLIERIIFGSLLSFFNFVDRIGQWYAIDTWNNRNIVCKQFFPFRPLTIILKLSRVRCLRIRGNKFDIQLSDLSQTQRLIERRLIKVQMIWHITRPEAFLNPVHNTSQLFGTPQS
jgi:hypothetical protein